MNKVVLLSSVLALTMLLSFSTDYVLAHPHPGQVMINGHTHSPQTETIPLNGIIALEKTTVFFHSPEDNKLPWAYVEGNIANHVEGYPVIIQIFKDDGVVHFAQTNVESDGDYEYKFRVLNSHDDITTKIFNGDYSVKIFKVVYVDGKNLI
jgi:hypothetical protein